MLDVIEDIRNEFKIKLTDDLEKEVIAFLNTQGGNIFIGVDDKGNVVGLNLDVDLLQRTIKDRIKDNIMPSTIGLYDVVVLDYEDKKYIKIIVARGVERPYYLKGMKMILKVVLCDLNVQRNVEILLDLMVISRVDVIK